MRVIALFNQKGGVGKTTTAVNLGAALAHSGHRVILVDLDPQANLTAHLGLDQPGQTTYQVLSGEAGLDEILLARGEHLRVAPSQTDLAAAEVELVGTNGRELRLRRAAQAARLEADFCLIDCPPGLGVLTLNALAWAQEVIIPLQAHFLALQGVAKLLETCALVRKKLNATLHVSGILFCQYESASRHCGEVASDVEAFLAEARAPRHPLGDTLRRARIFETQIRRNIKLAEAPSFGQSIFEYAPNSAGAADYGVLAEEVQAMRPDE